MAKAGYTKFGVGLDESAKRDHIEAAAKRIFGRIGYRGATVNDILSEAGISRRTFYSYFKSKEDVLVRFLDKFTVEILRVRDAEAPDALRDTDELRGQVARLAVNLMGLMLENREIIKVLFEGLSTDDNVLAPRAEDIVEIFNASIREYIEVALNRGLIYEVDPGIASSLLTGAYLEVIRRVLIKNDPTPPDRWAGEIVAFVERGFIRPAP